MFALQLIAMGLLLVSAACFFGPQLVAYGTRGISDLSGSTEARFVAGCLVSIFALAVAGPQVTGAFMTGGETIMAMCIRTAGLSFGLV